MTQDNPLIHMARRKERQPDHRRRFDEKIKRGGTCIDGLGRRWIGHRDGDHRLWQMRGQRGQGRKIDLGGGDHGQR